MASERRTCVACNKDFLILEQEQAFLQRKDLPLPVECPACRQDKRLAMRNERSLYRRPCNKCGVTIVSTYSPDSPYVVYCQKCYWEYTG